MYVRVGTDEVTADSIKKCWDFQSFYNGQPGSWKLHVETDSLIWLECEEWQLRWSMTRDDNSLVIAAKRCIGDSVPLCTPDSTHLYCSMRTCTDGWSGEVVRIAGDVEASIVGGCYPDRVESVWSHVSQLHLSSGRWCVWDLLSISELDIVW